MEFIELLYTPGKRRFSQETPLDKKNVLTISSEVRSLLREELKNRVGGGDKIKKINRPIS